MKKAGTSLQLFSSTRTSVHPVPFSVSLRLVSPRSPTTGRHGVAYSSTARSMAGPRRCGNRIKVKISRLSRPPLDVEGRGASTLWPAGAELQAAPGPHPFGRLAENCSRACGTSHQGLRFCTGSRKAATAGLNRQREHKVEVQGRP
jgi:hypothetical protein